MALNNFQNHNFMSQQYMRVPDAQRSEDNMWESGLCPHVGSRQNSAMVLGDKCSTGWDISLTPTLLLQCKFLSISLWLKIILLTQIFLCKLKLQSSSIPNTTTFFFNEKSQLHIFLKQFRKIIEVQAGPETPPSRVSQCWTGKATFPWLQLTHCSRGCWKSGSTGWSGFSLCDVQG